MPGRNIVKKYDVNAYYHVYTRGVDKQPIFRSEEDFEVFLSLLKRYLSPERSKTPFRTLYKNYSTDVTLIAYALMKNHVHLFLYQHEDIAGISNFMRSLLTSYSMYFNRKYDRVGPLFQSRYLASRITNDAYFHHISRYIHRNPAKWRNAEYTSLRYFLGEATADWIHPEQVLDMSADKYLEFVEDFEPKDDDLSWHLANQD